MHLNSGSPAAQDHSATSRLMLAWTGPSLMREIGSWTDPSHENHKPFAKGPGLAMHAWYLHDKPSPKPCSTAHMQKLVHVYFEALHENETDMSNNPDQGVRRRWRANAHVRGRAPRAPTRAHHVRRPFAHILMLPSPRRTYLAPGSRDAVLLAPVVTVTKNESSMTFSLFGGGRPTASPAAACVHTIIGCSTARRLSRAPTSMHAARARRSARVCCSARARSHLLT